MFFSKNSHHESSNIRGYISTGCIKLAAVITLGSSMIFSNVAHAERENSYTLMMNQDSFFGFYPSFNGLLSVKEDFDFSFYGILWTRDSFGTSPGASSTGGDDLWTEFGAGGNWHFMDGNLTVKPQIGITNGALLSRGNPNANGTNDGGNFADGVVPSLTVNYSDNKWEAEWYSGYYAALRNRGDNGALDFLHLWANGGYKFSPYVSAGFHYELLENTVVEGGDGGTSYEWIGGYLQFSLPKGMFARLSGGSEIQGDSSADFYKLNVGTTF